MEDSTINKMKSIIFYVTNSEDSAKAVKYLTDAIKAREDAAHKLYFKFLMGGAYMLAMGCEDNKGEKYFVGNHEIIFIPSIRQRDIDRLKELKEVVWYKNCMIISGDNGKAVALRDLLIDWLLEKKEDFDYEEK